MKINWTVRLRNKVFWATFIPAMVTFIYTVLGLFGIVPSVTEDVLTTALFAVLSALSALGILVDPTTTGIGDSERAMEYTTPK